MSKENPHIALYPGSFDGLTYGHLDIIERGAKLFDLLIVAVAHNEEKNPVLTIPERIEALKADAGHLPNVEITSFQGLTMEYAEKRKANYVIRSIRAVSDFEHELQMAMMNRALNARVETLFIVPDSAYLYVSSSLIKIVLKLGGDVSRFVPPASEKLLRARLNIPAPGKPGGKRVKK